MNGQPFRARYSTICPRCRVRIELGEQISWRKGGKAKHVACPTFECGPHVPTKADFAGFRKILAQKATAPKRDRQLVRDIQSRDN